MLSSVSVSLFSDMGHFDLAIGQRNLLSVSFNVINPILPIIHDDVHYTGCFTMASIVFTWINISWRENGHLFTPVVIRKQVIAVGNLE